MRVLLPCLFALAACPALPPPSGCTPHAYACRVPPGGTVPQPAVCSASQRWTPIGDGCPAGTVCTLSTDRVALCATPPSYLADAGGAS